MPMANQAADLREDLAERREIEQEQPLAPEHGWVHLHKHLGEVRVVCLQLRAVGPGSPHRVSSSRSLQHSHDRVEIGALRLEVGKALNECGVIAHQLHAVRRHGQHAGRRNGGDQGGDREASHDPEWASGDQVDVTIEQRSSGGGHGRTG